MMKKSEMMSVEKSITETRMRSVLCARMNGPGLIDANEKIKQQLDVSSKTNKVNYFQAIKESRAASVMASARNRGISAMLGESESEESSESEDRGMLEPLASQYS